MENDRMSQTLTMSIQSVSPAILNSEDRLVRQSLQGDQQAFGALVRRHQNRVFRLVGRFYRKAEDVEDTAQEVFLLIWRKLATYRREAPFEHWLTRLTLNLCYQRLRKKKIKKVNIESVAEPQAPPASDPTAKLEAERLLAHLSGQDRFILLLLYGEGWSVQEIADNLGWTRSNVKIRAFRARKRLRKILDSEVK